MRKPLYAISNEYMQAYDALYGDNELTEEVVRDTLAGIQCEFEAKAVNIAAIIKNMRADSKAMRDAVDTMFARYERLERQIAHLENYLLENMQAAGLTKPIETPEHYIGIKKCPVSVRLEPVYQIPGAYMRFIPEKFEPDKKLLKEALERGESYDGVSLIQNTKLVIK